MRLSVDFPLQLKSQRVKRKLLSQQSGEVPMSWGRHGVVGRTMTPARLVRIKGLLVLHFDRR